MYEYTIEEVAGPAEALARLNQLGEAEWEAFTVEPLAGGAYRLWLLRRPDTVSNVARGLESQREGPER